GKGRAAGVDVVYLVVGKLTGLLKEVRAGESVTVWGPLGNGFLDLPPPSPSSSPPGGEGRVRGDHVGLVAGGIGQTPFLAHVRELLGQRGYGGGARPGGPGGGGPFFRAGGPPPRPPRRPPPPPPPGGARPPRVTAPRPP